MVEVYRFCLHRCLDNLLSAQRLLVSLNHSLISECDKPIGASNHQSFTFIDPVPLLKFFENSYEKVVKEVVVLLFEIFKHAMEKYVFEDKQESQK